MSSEKIVSTDGDILRSLNAAGYLRKHDAPDRRTVDSANVVDLRTGSGDGDRSRETPRLKSETSELKIHKSVSVVVPTCDRIDLLNRCLEALSRQELSAKLYEIIVVDDGPHPDTQKIAEDWAQRMQSKRLDIIYIANHGPHGPAAARNRGWRAARAPIIAFTDDDTVPTPGWLKNGLSLFGDTVHAICGRVVMPLPSKPTDYERDARQLETAEFSTANCFCRKEVLDFINGFDERFRLAWREDSDLYFRLLGLRATILYASHAVVVHPVRPAPWGVSISQQRKMVFDALLYKKHPLLYRQKISATPRWDYYLIVAALLMAIVGILIGNFTFTLISGAVWAGMTARFLLMRLRGTTKAFSHIAEMVVTSIFIPPQAVFWRIVGAWRFKVFFV